MVGVLDDEFVDDSVGDIVGVSDGRIVGDSVRVAVD